MRWRTDSAFAASADIILVPQTFVSGNRLWAGTETSRRCGVDPARPFHFQVV
jgi:hypothetical protein